MRHQLVLLITLGLVAAYRAWMVRPLGLDGYLLYLPGWVFLPLLLVLAFLGRKLRKVDIAVVLSASVLLFGVIWPLRWSWSPSTEGSIRLVSLNIQSYRTDLPAAAVVLLARRPDFICFQEVWKTEHLRMLESSLPTYQLFSHPSEKEIDGFYDYGTFVAVRRDWVSESVAGPESTAWVKVEKEGTELNVVSFHGRKLAGEYDPWSLLSTLELQRLQMEAVASTHDSLGAPLLIGGDFNALPSGPAFKIFPLVDAFAEVGRGFGSTFPSRFPCIQLDHAMGSSEVTFRSFESFDAGSDHLAVSVTLDLGKEGRARASISQTSRL